MADPVVNSLRIDNLEGDCKETVRRVDGLEEECAEISDRVAAEDKKLEDRIRGFEYWKNGNGTRGAEVRLQTVEVTVGNLVKCVEKVASDESIAKIAAVVVKEVIGNARSKDKTWVAKAGAIARILTPVALIVGSICGLILYIVSKGAVGP